MGCGSVGGTCSAAWTQGLRPSRPEVLEKGPPDRSRSSQSGGQAGGAQALRLLRRICRLIRPSSLQSVGSRKCCQRGASNSGLIYSRQAHKVVGMKRGILIRITALLLAMAATGGLIYVSALRKSSRQDVWPVGSNRTATQSCSSKASSLGEPL